MQARDVYSHLGRPADFFIARVSGGADTVGQRNEDIISH